MWGRHWQSITVETQYLHNDKQKKRFLIKISYNYNSLFLNIYVFLSHIFFFFIEHLCLFMYKSQLSLESELFFFTGMKHCIRVPGMKSPAQHKSSIWNNRCAKNKQTKKNIYNDFRSLVKLENWRIVLAQFTNSFSKSCWRTTSRRGGVF